VATNKLTDTAIRNARPAVKEFELTDGEGLALRIKPDNRRLWSYRYTSPASKKPQRLWLGSYPTLSLKAARDLRASRAELVARGIDPKNATALLDEVGDQIPATVGQLFASWFDKEVKVNRANEDDRASIEGRYRLYVKPVMGDVGLADARRGHCMKAIDGARAKGLMRTANLLLVEMRQMYGFAVAREWMQGDPTAAIKRRDAGGQDKEGDRVLADDELVMLRDIVTRPPAQKSRYYMAVRRVLPARTELMMWWTLATAARAIEVASIKAKGAVDTEARTWTIPADIAKNRLAHIVQLNDFALAVWARIEQLETEGEYIFAGRDGGHLSEKEATRRFTDRQTREKPVKGRKNSTDLDLPGGRWTQHDLRRTASTIMGELGFSAEVIDRCLNHKEAKKVTRTYQRQKMIPQRQAAFEALGAHLTVLMGDPEGWLPIGK
jgi:site-specific recombinase XerD